MKIVFYVAYWCLLDNFLYQHVLEPTRIRSGQKENILDLVLTKEEEYIHDLDFMNPVGKSDHLVLRIVLNEPIKHLVRQPLGSTLFWGLKFFFQWILFASIPILQNILVGSLSALGNLR